MVRAVVGSLFLVACGTSTIPAQTTQTTSALTLSSAVVATTSSTLLSCHGGALCREHVVAPGHEDVLEDATNDCARRGGTLEHTRCRRDGRLASCAVDGEAGPITVFLYGAPGTESSALAKMTSLCEELEGSFELATR